MDRSGAPAWLWLLGMMYCAFLLNHLVHTQLNWCTPIECAFSYTPDVSALLCFTFYAPVLYCDVESSFPNSKELPGHFGGIAENVGDALTFKILTDDTQEIIYRSVVRPANDPDNPNRCSIPLGGEEAPVIGESISDVIDPTVLKLLTIDPIDIIGKTFLMEREIDGSLHRAEVMKQIETHEGKIDQY